MNKDKHQESAAAEALHNLKAGDGKDSEDQTSVNNQQTQDTQDAELYTIPRQCNCNPRR